MDLTYIGQDTTHMNSCIIITAGLGVPLITDPSTILCMISFYITSKWYTINVLQRILMYLHKYFYVNSFQIYHTNTHSIPACVVRFVYISISINKWANEWVRFIVPPDT